MKRKLCISMTIIIVLIVIVSIIRLVIYPFIQKRRFENNIVDFLNGKNSNITDYTKWLEYANSDKPIEYNIDGLINDYISCIEKAVNVRINDKNKYYFEQYYKSGGLDIITEHGIKDNWIEYISNNITNQDIEDYNNNILRKKIIKKLESCFKHKSDKQLEDWYVQNENDRVIEAPYNIYYSFKADNKVLKNEVKYVISVNTKLISKHYTECNIKYMTNDDKISYKTIKLFNSLNKKTQQKTYFYSDFSDLYYYNSTIPEIIAGQHDYDKAQEEELKKEAEEPYVELPHRNWDDYDDEGNYIGETSSARVVTSKEEFEEMIRKNSERAKELGIEESTISREEAIERLNKIKKEAGIE